MLTAAQVEQCRELGYLVVPDVLDRDLLAEVRRSALNTSAKPRRLLLHEYAAADAWPLMGVGNFAEFNGRMVLGRPTIEPRLAPAPVRMPLPPAPFQGSIFENQKAAAKRFFATAAE